MDFNIWATTESDEQLIGSFIGSLTLKGWKTETLSNDRAYNSAGENQLSVVALSISKNLKLEKDETVSALAHTEITSILNQVKIKWFALIVVNFGYDNSMCWNSNRVPGFDEVMKTMVIR